ncbi:hypothetical protein BKA83DRAFT_4484143, partial [Pisolithus microcarpus]
AHVFIVQHPFFASPHLFPRHAACSKHGPIASRTSSTHPGHTQYIRHAAEPHTNRNKSVSDRPFSRGSHSLYALFSRNRIQVWGHIWRGKYGFELENIKGLLQGPPAPLIVRKIPSQEGCHALFQPSTPHILYPAATGQRTLQRNARPKRHLG